MFVDFEFPASFAPVADDVWPEDRGAAAIVELMPSNDQKTMTQIVTRQLFMAGNFDQAPSSH